MQEGLQTYTLLKFSGIRNWESDSRIPNNFLYYALNSEFNGGLWKSAKGPIQYLSALASGTNIRAINYYPFQNASGIKSYVIEVYNKQAYLIDTGTDARTTIAGATRATDEDAAGVTFTNVFYLNSVTDGMAWFNGTAWSTVFASGIIGDPTGNGADFTVTNGGNGYINTPNVRFSGGGGTGAIALVNGITLTGFQILNGGTGYTAPVVTISAPTLSTGINASASITQVAGIITNITLTNAGTGYQFPPSVTITDPNGTKAVAIPIFAINNIALQTSGSSYSSAPTIIIDAPTGPAPLVQATATIAFTTGTPPAGSMMEANAGKIWVAGGGTNPAVVYYNRTATADHPEYARDWVNGAGRALVGEGGYITALKNLKNVLYVFKNNAIHYLTGFNTSGPYPIPTFDIYAVTSGAVNSKCVVQVENDLWFLNAQGEIRSLGAIAGFINDNRTQDVSIAIKRYMQALSQNFSNAAMSYQNKLLKVSHRTVNSPTNNWEFTYDFNDFGYSIKQMVGVKQYVVTGNRRFFSEDGTSGQLYEDDAAYTQGGLPFTWKGYSLMVDVGRPDLYKRLRYVSIHLARTAGQAVTLDVYQDNFVNAPAQYTLAAPSLAETGTPTFNTNGVYGMTTFGTAPWGGNSGITSNNPTLYRKLFKVDINQTAKQFSIGLEAVVNGGIINVEEIILQYITLPERYRPSDI